MSGKRNFAIISRIQQRDLTCGNGAGESRNIHGAILRQVYIGAHCYCDGVGCTREAAALSDVTRGKRGSFH